MIEDLWVHSHLRHTQLLTLSWLNHAPSLSPMFRTK
jgi:hypothetical protein